MYTTLSSLTSKLRWCEQKTVQKYFFSGSLSEKAFVQEKLYAFLSCILAGQCIASSMQTQITD